MMTLERKRLEQQVLSRRLPANTYVFRDLSPWGPVLTIAARTNKKHLYTLNIVLTDFPESVPKVFVNQMLLNKTGGKLDSASASMHTLTSENNWTRLCHYGPNSWTPMVSLYKIYVKCRLWLEMYEQHLVTGKNIDYYLNHQQ